MDRNDPIRDVHSSAPPLHRRSPSNRWFFGKQPSQLATSRLFCFAFAGGSASMFAPWTKQLAAETDVCPVELPGRWSRWTEPPYTDMLTLQADLTRALEGHVDRPFCLFGYSLGGLVAYELAHSLRRAYGVEPRHLIVAARGAPHYSVRSTVTELDDDAFLAAISQLYGPMPEAIARDPEMRTMAIRITRSDMRILESYRHEPQPPLECPITVFGGTQDASTGEVALRDWSEFTRGRFEMQLFEGDHFFVNANSKGMLDAVRHAIKP